MKKSILITVIAISSIVSFSQVPDAFNYQAVLRNADGTVKANETVTIQINIVNNKGASSYLEIHNTQTNEFGIVNLVVGKGTTSDVFSNIDWSVGPYYLDITVNSEALGSSPLLSVPYALHAGKVDIIEETDPVFSNWDKSSGISISENQVADLQSYVLTEQDPVFTSSVSSGITDVDTAKWNAAAIGDFVEQDPVYSSSQAVNITEGDIVNLTNLSGTNTGDQDLSSFTTQQALEDSAQAIRSDFPDVSTYLETETDPLYSAWDKDYADLSNTPITITQDQVDVIVANSGKDTSGIFHANRIALDLMSGINTGDQDISIEDHSLTISNGSTIELPDEVDDNDSDPTNEIQELIYSNDTLKITKGSSFVIPGLPVGGILPFAGEIAPEGWLVCNGGEVSRSDYTRLFNVIGTAWGIGDGTSTFNLPDLRGLFLRGVDNTAGNDPDALTRVC